MVIFSLLNTKIAVYFFVNKKGLVDMLQTTPAIELVNITKCFGKVIANKNVNLTVNKGEILSILGENGSGKTTLMNISYIIFFVLFFNNS